MIGDLFERAAGWIGSHPLTVYAVLGLGFVGTCTAIRNNPRAAQERHNVLHAPALDPYIVCPHCDQRFTLDQSNDYDDVHIEMYIERSRINWFEGEGR